GAAQGAAAMGDPQSADAFAVSAREAAARTGNPFAIAFVALTRIRIAGYGGRRSIARSSFDEAIRAYEELGDPRFVLIAKSDFAHALRHAGLPDEAEAIYRDTIRGWQRLGSPGAIASQLESFAFLAISAHGWS